MREEIGLIPADNVARQVVEYSEDLEERGFFISGLDRVKEDRDTRCYEFFVLYDEDGEPEARDHAMEIARKIAHATGRHAINDDGVNEYLYADMKVVPVANGFEDQGLQQLKMNARGEDWLDKAFDPPDPGTVTQIMDAGEIAEIEVEQEHIAYGLLGAGETLVLPSDTGVGKSLLITQTALQMAYAPENPLFELFTIPKPITSLIVQSENAMAAQSGRLKKLLTARPDLRGMGRVHFLANGRDCRTVGSFTNPDFQKLIVDSLHQVKADLVIFDPLISFAGAGENDNTAMRQSLDALQEKILDVAGVGAIITHHFNRQGKARGASAIRDWAANWLILEPVKREAGEVIIKCIHDKARNYPEVDPFFLRRTKNLEFVRTGEPGSKADRQVDAVVAALAGLGGAVDRQAPLLEAVQVRLNCKRSAGQNAIALACEERKIQVTPGGGAGKPTGYHLPGQKPAMAGQD